MIASILRGELLALAVSVLAHRPVEAVRPYVEAAQIAEHETGVSARLLLAVAVVESNVGATLTGDGGRACGAWQYHARYSPAARILGAERVCQILRDEPLEAALHAADRIAHYEGKICHYNQGVRCLRGEHYTARVERVLEALGGGR